MNRLKHMKELLGILFISIIVAGLTGCASLSPAAANGIATGAKIVAKDATIISLEQHPEWRKGFQTALDDISVAANAEKIDLRTIVGIIQRLPVKELHGRTAMMVTSDVTIIIEDFTTNQATVVSAEDYAKVRQVVVGLRDGIQLGLDSVPVQ